MTDAERVELIRDILKSKVSPAAMIEVIRPIVGELIPVPNLEQEFRPRDKQVDSQPATEIQKQERFLTLHEVCARAGYCPNTIHSYRARNLSHKLKLPKLIKRGDGQLGCLESDLEAWLKNQYRTQAEET